MGKEKGAGFKFMARKGLIMLFFLSLGFISVEAGYGAESTFNVEEIVVTATRIPEPKSEVSSFVQVLSEERLSLSPSQDLGSFITQAGIGHIHRYPGFLTGRVAIRGLASDLFDQQKSRLLLLSDGVKIGTINFAKIPLQDVERVEIVKGPASVLYGSQAMGGVINVITKRAKKEGFYGEIGATCGSWDFYQGSVELMGKKDKVDFYFSSFRAAQNDYESKDFGRIPNTSWDAEATTAKVGFTAKSGHDLLFTLQYFKAWKIGNPGPRYYPSLNDYSDKGRMSTQFEYTNPFTKFKVFFVKDEDEWHYPSTGDITKKETETKGGHFLGNFTLGKHFKFLGGLDFNVIEVSTKRVKGAPYFPNSEHLNFGLFCEGRGIFLQDRLLLNGGIRYDFFEAKIKRTSGLTVYPRTRDFENFTLRGGLVFKLKDGVNLKSNLGTGFRAPAPDELAADYINNWGIRYIGNPDLKPEKSYTFDLGIEINKTPFKLQSAYFMTNFKDKIITLYNSTTKTNTFHNVDGAEIHGWELNLSFDLAPFLKLPFSFEPYVDLTYHTKYISKDKREILNYGTETLLYTPKGTGTLGVRLLGESWAADFHGIYMGKEKVIDWNWNSPTYGKAIKKGDFTIFNLGLRFSPYKHFEGSLKVENLFNKAYEYVPSYPMPKRTIFVGGKFKF